MRLLAAVRDVARCSRRELRTCRWRERAADLPARIERDGELSGVDATGHGGECDRSALSGRRLLVDLLAGVIEAADFEGGRLRGLAAGVWINRVAARRCGRGLHGAGDVAQLDRDVALAFAIDRGRRAGIGARARGAREPDQGIATRV